MVPTSVVQRKENKMRLFSMGEALNLQRGRKSSQLFFLPENESGRNALADRHSKQEVKGVDNHEGASSFPENIDN